MLDKSGSIGVNNWQKQIEFLKNLTEHLDVSVNRTRVAALQHATKADVMFGFDDKTSRKEVIDALDLNIHQQTSGNSKYHRALNYSLYGIFKPPLRQKARKFIIGLTDDMDNQSLSDKTKQYVREADEKAIHVITICMKLHTWDCAEASTPGYNVSVHRAGKLNEALPDVIQLICPCK
ncbi:hypothetical protein FSP39_013827 [Pinctada imbricata]|uniref:VWFA domain-containing protein n=1 Tax=Pinctada imbricata TaxID=66713 RepID=A0AA89C7J7_PINIB|nr:hypothetical protein FSP39_013827 [Pinctada imbricata]